MRRLETENFKNFPKVNCYKEVEPAAGPGRACRQPPQWTVLMLTLRRSKQKPPRMKDYALHQMHVLTWEFTQGHSEEQNWRLFFSPGSNFTSLNFSLLWYKMRIMPPNFSRPP